MSDGSTTNSGQTNLFEAILESSNQSVVCELISAACPGDVNITDKYGRTALFVAVTTSNYESVVRALIKAGADVNTTDNEGRTALFYAVTRSNYESVVRALIDAGADVNKTDNRGKTALFYAVQKSNNESVVRALIDAKADPNKTDVNKTAVNKTDNVGKTALFYAVQQSNNDSVVRALIVAGTVVNKTDNEGKTALFYAVQQSNNESVVRALIDAGTDVNTTDNEEKTALHYACERMQNREIGIGIVQALIAAGADVNKSDKDGNAALSYARNKSLFSALVHARGANVNTTDASGQTALFYAVQQSNNESVVRAFIDAKADVNRTDNEGKTALFYACTDSTNEVVVWELRINDANANVKITDNDGQTALFYAVQTRNNERVVRKLIDAGADVNLTDNQGKTALFYAVGERVVRELIDADTDVNIIDKGGRTVLLQAIQNRYDKSVIYLLIDASDVNTTDNKGKSALFHALQQSNNEDMVRKLIDAGADVNAIDANGETALCYAVHYANESVVRALIDAGADVNKTLSNGQTALIRAVYYGNDKVVSTLTGAGADVNITDNSGKTLLFYAIEHYYNKNLLSALINAGVDVNKTDHSGKSALFYLVKSRGSKDEVSTFIDGGADVNITDHDGKTALFYAVCSDNEPVVLALIDAGAKVDMIDTSGKTPLFYAIQEKNSESVVLALIVADRTDRTDLNIVDCFGQTALFYAVQRRNNQNIVQALIDAGADVKKTDIFGQTALFLAVQQRNNKNIVRSLVEADNDILNIRDIYGRTAMLYVNYNSPETFAYLLEKGGKRCLQLKDNCNVNIVTLVIENYLSETVMFMDRNDPEVLGELLKQGLVEREGVAKEIINIMFRKYISDVLNIHSMATEAAPQNVEAFKGLAKLYKEYVDNNVWQRKEKMESLIKLLEKEFRNTTKILEILIELGADPDSADSHGNTALHYATRLPLSSASQDLVKDVCRHLKALGVRFNTKNHQDQTPLLLCPTFYMPHMTESVLQSVIKSVVEVCIFLLNNGSSIEETSRTGESVFHLIVKLFQSLLLHEKAREEVLRDLIRLLQWIRTAEVETSMAVNKLDIDLNSPLHLWASLILPSPADYSSHLTKEKTFKNILQQIFEILLECGAKLNPRNENEDTPLHLCKTWTAVKLLIDAGANTNDLNSSKRSPLLVAAKEKTYLKKPCCLYPDVSQEKKSFWKEALEMGLDLWTVDKNDESVLSILVESEAFALAKSLVDVACEDSYTKSESITISLLNALCKDKSIRTNWKANLVQDILKSRKSTSLSKPLRYCCENVIETGVRDVKQEDKTDSAVAVSLAEGDDNDAPPPKRRTDESDGKSEAQADLYQGPVTVHCEIIKLLRWYGAGGEACEEIAKEYSQLSDLLLKPLTDDQIQEFIPWTSISKKYEDKLAKVARRQEFEMLQQIWYHRDHIGSGSFGLIFAGINEKDGREVAIKRIERLRLQRPEDKREIQNLTALADCQQVVRYLSFCEDQHFCYVVLELMEGNLEEYLNESTIDASEATRLCKDVVIGLKFLHEQNILHRDLKPQNILYKKHPDLCLKIADFGLSRRIDSTSTTVYGTNAGTRCWIAPELLKLTMDHSKSSDMFSCGLLLHYILSEQKHPFSPADCANKSEPQIVTETESNIMNGKAEGLNNSLCPEASHVVNWMLESDEKKRPSAAEVLNHPFCYSKKKIMDLLKAVGNQPEIERPAHFHSPALNADLERNFSTIVKRGTWNDPGYLHMPAIYTEMRRRRRRRYDTWSVVALVRFIRNTYAHVSENTRPSHMRKLLLEDFVFLEYFPDLVMEVYKAVITHGWDQTRDEIKYAMNK